MAQGAGSCTITHAEHPERWERPGCCIKHGMQITQNHKDGRSCENAAGVSVYQLIVTKLSNREKLVVEGSRAELDELFRLYTMHRR